MKITYRMAAIEEELAELTYLSGGKETPRIKKLINEYQEEMKKLEETKDIEGTKHED
jgi:hypothetical protein